MNVKFNVFEAPEIPKFYFRDSQAIFDITKGYGKSNREMFLILHLDAKLGLITKEIHSIGTVDSSAVYPREVARSAILNNASAVILLHNHPSGDPTPSAPDKDLTLVIMEGLALFDIKVLDNIILGRDTYYSFADQGIIEKYNYVIENKPRRT